MTDRDWWEKRKPSTEITHYRDEHATYLDCELWNSDIVELGWEAQYTWLRLLSGPEYKPLGFPISRTSEAFGSPREFDYEAAIEALLRLQVIGCDGDYYTFPNVIWGTPPEEED